MDRREAIRAGVVAASALAARGVAAATGDRVHLFQCHWQDRLPPYRSEFIAQAGFTERQLVETSCRCMYDWASGVFERRKAECPAGRVPMVCDEHYEGFARTVR